jgi:hypothetical protein
MSRNRDFPGFRGLQSAQDFLAIALHLWQGVLHVPYPSAPQCMKPRCGNQAAETRPSPGAEQAATRVTLPLLLAVIFAAGIGVGAFWFSRKAGPTPPPGPPQVVLSEQTRNVLRGLTAPVEIRFYDLLDTSSLPGSWTAFAGRVSDLLAAYQQAAAGRITLTRYDSPSDSFDDKAHADGIQPFNLDKGAACYLGMVVSQDGRSETLPHLSPEYEQALEFDLTRAIARVATPPPAPPVSAETATNQAAAAEQVGRAIPDPANTSLDQGIQILRDAALAEFKAAAQAGQEQVKEAQGKSEAEHQAAVKALQQVQAEQTDKLKEIAARLQNQLDAWRRMKAGTNPPAAPQ